MAETAALGCPDGPDMHHSGLRHPLHIRLVEKPCVFIPSIFLPHSHSHSIRRHPGRRLEGLLPCILRHATGHASFHARPLGQRLLRLITFPGDCRPHAGAQLLSGGAAGEHAHNVQTDRFRAAGDCVCGCCCSWSPHQCYRSPSSSRAQHGPGCAGFSPGFAVSDSSISIF